MFDIGWQELFLVAVLALIVIGPKDLPKAMRTVRGAIRKLREMAREFQSGVDEMMREAELDDVRDSINRASQLDPKKSISETIDPTGDLAKDLEDFDEVKRDMNDAAQDFKRQTDPDAPEPASEPAHEPAHEEAGETATSDVAEDEGRKASASTAKPAGDEKQEG